MTTSSMHLSDDGGHDHHRLHMFWAYVFDLLIYTFVSVCNVYVNHRCMHIYYIGMLILMYLFTIVQLKILYPYI
jgi:hypothetical protein